MHLFLLLDRVLAELVEVCNKFPRPGVGVSGKAVGGAVEENTRSGAQEGIGI